VGPLGNVKEVESLLEWPGELLDRIVTLLEKVGVDVAPITLQLFLLAIVVGLLFVTLRRRSARRKRERSSLIGAIALALVAAGIVIGIAENATTPGRVAGFVKSDHLAELQVALLDFRDREISRGSGRVDTATGRFALHYSPLVDGRARKLRISSPGCKLRDFDLSRSQLRSEAEITRSYPCASG
jgi:hypothetical protein